MNDFNASSLKREYFDWLFEKESFNDVGYHDQPVVRIETPFLDDSFDGVDIYVYPELNGQVRVTDNGETLDNLEGQGIFFDKRTTTRSKILTDILESFGIERASDSKKLYITSRREQFPDAKHRMLQGILRIIDLTYTGTDNVKNLFQDQVEALLKDNGIIFSKSRAIAAPNGLSFIFDFIIPTVNNGDTVVRTFHSPQFINGAKVFSWDAERINRYPSIRPGQYIAIIDDDAENSTTDSIQQFQQTLADDTSAIISGVLFSEMADRIKDFSNKPA